MQTLQQSLQDQDLGFLRALAERWGLEISGRDREEALQRVCERILDYEEAEEIVGTLPQDSREALHRLMLEGWRLPIGDFIRRHGEIRSMGPGRRDREKPWRSPISSSERLFYYGLIARGFADSPAGPKEFVFVPLDLRPVFQKLFENEQPLQKPDPTTEAPASIKLASSAMLDDATTLLAALRRRPAQGESLSPSRLLKLHEFMLHPTGLPLLTQLLLDQGVLSADPLKPNTAELPSVLEAPRNIALHQLCQSWQNSKSWHDLYLLDHLEVAGGQLPQDPRTTRSATLALFEATERNQWIDLDAFVEEVKHNYPTFARPGDDFDSWLLRDRRTGNFLQGWEAWDAVDGALLRAMIRGPLHWLGAVDLGYSEEGSERLVAFRLTAWFQVLTEQAPPPELSQPEASAELSPEGRLILPRAVPRRLRYQIARLCSWEALQKDQYHYRLRPSAVLAASEQGLRAEHIEKLLNELSAAPIPPALTKAISRLMSQGMEAVVQDTIVLRVKSAALLDRLLEVKNTARWIKERLGPTAAVVNQEALPRLLEASARSGILIEPPDAGN